MANKPVMKMPELLVFTRLLIAGFVGAEVWRTAFYLGTNFAQIFSTVPVAVQFAEILLGLLLCLTYAVKRGAHVIAGQIGRSFRIDLLIAVGIGIWINALSAPWVTKIHAALEHADPLWAPAILLLLCVVLLSPLIQEYWPKSRMAPQLYFINDEEITSDQEDVLANEMQAKSFAETVLASSAHSGLVFGVDGPWGTGKTSFINLAERHWNSADRAIVCRFEPLRYASEPDLGDRLIRDLSATIRRKVFAPEFRPAASRYSRLIKGKADVSFLGFKLSLEPSQETVDELLDDIDDVLKRIGRRVIIVVDDLDRLDAKATNNVLFATRQTFRLSQATYVLCYDTEILVGNKEEGSKAREFLEKFVTVKLSLFIDSSSLRDFLRRDWQRVDQQLGSIPSDTMLKLGAVLNELADILDGPLAPKYLSVVGNLRQVKRFVNAMLLVQLDKSNLSKTDFNKRDLINLMLLHLNYPGLFRRIYAEETEGRRGVFSVRREYNDGAFKNSAEFINLVEKQDETPQFLLRQLFDATTLKLGDPGNIDEKVLASRACFNHESSRNLEGYLKLIVRFTTPEPQATFVLYDEAVERVRKGTPIASVLKSSEFKLERGEHAHDQFWRVLVNRSYDFNRNVADNAIDTLVEYLPRYSTIGNDDRGLRQRSIYSLLRLLDRAGWGAASDKRRSNTAGNIVEIAWRIFGEHIYEGRGLLQRLASRDRGVLGWNDLMLFRLQCSIDRQGQLHNLHSALIIDQDKNAAITGLVNELALIGMRKLSQEVFALFKQTYIDQRRNFLSEVTHTSVESFLGSTSPQPDPKDPTNDPLNLDGVPFDQHVSAMRTAVKSFVVYQLSNRLPADGSGVGCGYYDENGTVDNGAIAMLMNDYMFQVCFNPNLHEENVIHFLDHCMSHLANAFFSDGDEDGYIATKAALPGALDAIEMGRYWTRYKDLIQQRALQLEDRVLFTPNYTASYGEYLTKVFIVLDKLAEDATANDVETDRTLILTDDCIRP